MEMQEKQVQAFVTVAPWWKASRIFGVAGWCLLGGLQKWKKLMVSDIKLDVNAATLVVGPPNKFFQWNGAEAKYELDGQSRMHGWTPKLSSRLFNMNFNNAYRIYLALMEKHNSGRNLVSMAKGVKEATHALLQRGSTTRTRALDHPSPVRDMRNVHNIGCGKRRRSDAKGVTTRARAVPAEYVSTKL